MSVQNSRPDICTVIKLQAISCIFKPTSTYWNMLSSGIFLPRVFHDAVSINQTGQGTYQADKSLINTQNILRYISTKNKAILSFFSAYMPMSLRYFSCFLDIIVEPDVHYGVQTLFTIKTWLLQAYCG